MDFNNYAYTRPDIELFGKEFSDKLDILESELNIEVFERTFEALNAMRESFDTMFNIGYIRHSINTKDDYYADENDFFDNALPQFQALTTRFYEVLINSPLKDHLIKKWGNQFFVIAESNLKIFKPDILEDLQQENKSSSEYTKLKAGAEIKLDEKIYNLSGLIPLESGADRNVRSKAAVAKWQFFAEISEKIEGIFSDLVKTRDTIAKKLGYKNFVGLGYQRMLRSDYNAEMVAIFRKQIQDHIVPLASRLYERQAKRIGLDKLKFYDEEFKFKSGNAAPKGSPDWIVAHAATMYKALSPETNDFFSYMQSNNLMDLVNRDGKATGGYCTYIADYKAPFIFSNFNGTSGDIDVLTHEAGHAFQVYSSRNFAIPEYHWPTYESCEIHSMSMEFFTWPWMQLFFEKDVDKYKFAHLSAALQFLPYGVAVDEFQHVIYENPEFTTVERNNAWKEIEKKYLPHRDYDGIEFLENGGFWQKQNHIFNSPFYYIDYALAQICAFQFWKKDQENHQTAWEDYVKLCKAGGSLSFLELVKLANLRSPFEEGCIAEVVGEIDKWLESIDDADF
ncbi:MAG: M3 family oligoendopeptidase [Saprospiraceae bacterium]